MQIGRINLQDFFSKIYDPGYKGEYKVQYNIWPIRLAVFLFLIVNFHWLNKQPIFKLDPINMSEFLYLICVILLLIFFKREISFKTQISALIFDFLSITFFVYLSLSTFGFYSWLYVLYLIPVIYCSFWFHWIFTTIFVTIVSATYSSLNYYYILNLGSNYKTFYEKISLLGPIIVIFYFIAFGVSYYKRKSKRYYEDIDKKVEEQTAELEREKEYNRNLLKSSFDAVIAVDRNGYITEVNERACELFEYDKEEMVTKKVKDFYAPGEGPRIMNKLRNSVDGSIENFNTYILSKKGEKIPILLSGVFLHDRSLNLKKELSKGRKFPTVGYFRDNRAEEAVDNIAKGITSIIHEKSLIDKVVEIVAKLLKAESCSLLAYNERTGRFKVITSYGMPKKLKVGERFESYDEKESMIAKISSSKKTLNIPNIDVRKKQPQEINIKWKYAQNFAKYSRFGDFKHFLGTPLVVQGEVYGVTRVLNKYCSDNELDKQGFTENDQKLLERISNQVSILVEKVRDKERFEAISKVGRELNEMVDVPLDDLLEIIAKEVVKGMRFKACYLRLIEDGENLKIKACYGLKGDYKNNKKYISKIGEGISGYVAKTGYMKAIEYLKNEREFKFKDILEKEELRSMLSIPLKYRNRVIGVINCYTRRIHRFTEQEIQIMNTFATYVSTAIQNKKRIDELMALNEIGSELVKPIKIDELFDLILERAKTLSGADCLCIKAYDERNGELKTARVLNCKWYEKNKNYTIDVKEGLGAEMLVEIIENGNSRIIPNYDNIRKNLWSVPGKEFYKDVKSCALVPIKIENEVFGIIFLDSYRENFFTEDDLLVLKAFSSQAAIALKNAKFFNKFHRVTETFPKISELDSNIDKVLDNIAEIAAEVLETDILVLYRYDEKNKKIIWPPIFKGDIIHPEFMMSQVGESDAPLLFISRGTNHYAEKSQKDPIMAPGQKPRKGVPQRFLFREKIVSSAGILLRVSQEIVGIMFVNYRRLHKFDEDERKIIENYASYIAIAIQNVRLFLEKEVGAGLQTLGQLAAVIAHKMKNDIGTISLYTGDLIDDISPKDPSYFSLSRIKEKVRKITSDIDNLLIASKRKIPVKEFIDIKILINEMEQEIVSDLKTKNIRLEKKITANIPKIKVDPAQIKMVLSNLAYNSIEAMPKGGKIMISISKLKHVVLLDWNDTGNGIFPENAEKVFQPFWTTKNKGFGLGLFLSKTIIEEHGGSISLDLNYKKGAKFIIKFPIKERYHEYRRKM